MTRRIRRYPGEDAVKAIDRASRKAWWSTRMHDDPVPLPGGRRWAWQTTEKEDRDG